MDMVNEVPVEKPHSTLGMVSVGLLVISAISLCIGFGTAFAIGFVTGGNIDETDPVIIAAGLCMIGSVLPALVGLGLGIAGVVDNTKQKLTAVIGLAGNIVLVLGVCCLVVFSMIQTYGQ